MKKNRKTI